MSASRTIIDSLTAHDANEVNEGLGAIAASKLADLARGFILKARPIIVVHRTKDNSTVTLKLRRGLINHILVRHEEGKGDHTISKSPSAAILLTRAVAETTKLFGQGYIEI